MERFAHSAKSPNIQCVAGTNTEAAPDNSLELVLSDTALRDIGTVYLVEQKIIFIYANISMYSIPYMQMVYKMA